MWGWALGLAAWASVVEVGVAPEEEEVPPLSVCDIPQRTCSKLDLGMTMVDVTFLTQGLLGFDTYVAPQGPPVHTFGSLERVVLELWWIRRQSPPSALHDRASATAQRVVATVEAIDTDAAVGREAADVEERRERLGNIDCVLGALREDFDALVADADAIEAALRAQDPDHPLLFSAGVLQGELAASGERLVYLEALVAMQWGVCAETP